MGPRAAHWRAGIVAAVLLAEPSIARANEPHVRIDFKSSAIVPDCDRPTDFEMMVDRLLIHPLLDPPAERILVARVRAAGPGRIGVRLTLTDLEGNKLSELEGIYPNVSCYEALDRASLLAAELIEPAQPKDDAPVCPPPPPPPPPPRLLPPPPPPPRPRPQLLPLPRLKKEFGLGVMVATGIIPNSALGLQLSGGISGSLLSLGMDVRGTLPIQDAPLGKTKVEMQTVSASVAPCLRVGGRLDLCVTLGAGWLRGSVVKVHSVVGNDAYVTLGPRVRVDGPQFGKISLRLDVEMTGAVKRAPIRSQWDTVAWETLPLTTATSISAVLAF